MKNIVMVLILTVTSLFAVEESCSAKGCLAKITRLYIKSDGVVHIETSQDERLANCTPVAGKYLTLSSSAPKEFYSTILAAYMSNKVVSFRISDGSDNCRISYIVIDKSYE